MKLITTILLIFFSVYLNAQHKIGSWQNHQALNSAIELSTFGNSVFIASTSGLFKYELDYNSLNTYSKSLPLSDIKVSAICYNNNFNNLIIGYENGNIDFLSSSSVLNINDLKNKNLTINKKILNIYNNNDYAYLACGFGLIILNVKKEEIKETCYIHPSEYLTVYDVTINKGKIWVATSLGVYYADKSNQNLQDYNSWTLFLETSANEPYTSIVNIEDDVFVNLKNNNNKNTGILIKDNGGGNFESINIYNNVNALNRVRYIDQSLYLVCDNKIIISNINGETINVIDKYKLANSTKTSITPTDIAKINDNFFISDYIYGLVDYSNSISALINPNRPTSNFSSHLLQTDNKLIVSTGGVEGDFIIPAHLHVKENDIWSSEYIKVDDKPVYSLIKTAQKPSDKDTIYGASWGYGLFIFVDNKFKNVYNEKNSPLKKYENWRIWISGVTFDTNGYLWMANSLVTPSLYALKESKWFPFDYPGIHETNNDGSTEFLIDIFIDSRGWKWVLMASSPLFIFDTKSTIEDTDDDLYRGPKTKRQDSDPRNVGQLKLWDENGEEITNRVYSLAEDKNGYIWVGTNKGVLVYYRPYAIFDEEKPIANRIKVPRNDGSNLADYLLEKETVTAIAIDGGNRKWLGTANSGVFLVSEDGTKTIQSFNIDNSPLISNSINSIAIHPKTGEVYIGTVKGIVSYKALATKGADSYSEIYAYPNPVRENYTGDIIITGLMENSTIKIVDISGKLVYETKSVGGQAVWNARNLHGKRVKTGVYVVFVSNEDGSEKATTKILIVN